MPFTAHNNNSACPDWFLEYERFHAAHRGRPDTKYLVQSADGSVLVGGLGDRLNGALFSLRLAYALKRVLLIHWTQPYKLESFLQPNLRVNWSADGIDLKGSMAQNFIDNGGWARPELRDGSLLQSHDTFLNIYVNAPVNWTCHGCPVLASEWSPEAACIWQRMFRPVHAVIEQAQQELGQALPEAMPYAAVHLRLGGLTGEPSFPWDNRGKDPFSNFMAGMRCADQSLRNHSMDTSQTAIMVVTDNHYLRQFVQGKHLRQLIAPGGLPVHLERAQGEGLDAHVSTFVDMLLLGQAECLITSRSGFSLHAWLSGGGKPCQRHLITCL
jgi:hypothetical protein